MKKHIAIAAGVLLTLSTAVAATLNGEAQKPVATVESTARRFWRCGRPTRTRPVRFRWRARSELTARISSPHSLRDAASFAVVITKV